MRIEIGISDISLNTHRDFSSVRLPAQSTKPGRCFSLIIMYRCSDIISNNSCDHFTSLFTLAHNQKNSIKKVTLLNTFFCFNNFFIHEIASKSDSSFLHPSNDCNLNQFSLAQCGKNLLNNYDLKPFNYDVFNLIFWSGMENELTKFMLLMLPLEYMDKALP